MSQLIEFLGKVGSDASLRYGGRDALMQAMDAEGLDSAFHESVTAGDIMAVKRALQLRAAPYQAIQLITDF